MTSTFSYASATEESTVRTFRWDLSSETNPHGIGGWLSGLLVGPLDGEIVKTRFKLTFATADAWDVSGLSIHLQGPVETTPGIGWTDFDLTAQDLGWSGVGHFSTVYETDALNGPLAVVNNVSIWPFELNEFGYPYIGRYLELRIEFDVKDLVFNFTCYGDLNLDSEIDGTDLRLFSEGPCPANETCLADINRDGSVTREDRASLVGMLGSICPVTP
jgi:hypothetical protein